MSTAPTRPPPGPWTVPPGFGVFGPACWLQHAEASEYMPLVSASSKVTTSSPSAIAGELRITGTYLRSHASALTSPPGCPSTHGSSWPSLHRFGVMNEKFAVVDVLARSLAIW